MTRLTKTYRKHAARLRQTGGGLEDENCANSQEEHIKYYIPGEGPNETTPVDALNLWRAYFRSNSILTLTSSLIEQIEKDFKFFPHLHKIFAARPNVTPIIVTTALGPQGRKTVWFQPPDEAADATAGSAVQLASPSTPAHSPSHTFGTDVTQATVNINRTPAVPAVTPQNTDTRPPVSAGKRGPKSSGISQEAINKARLNIEKVPQKRTLLDTLLEMQEYVSCSDVCSYLINLILIGRTTRCGAMRQRRSCSSRNEHIFSTNSRKGFTIGRHTLRRRPNLRWWSCSETSGYPSVLS